MKRRPSKPIVVRETDEMANWMHPQTPERKQRIKDRMAAASARYKNLVTWGEVADQLTALSPEERKELDDKAAHDAAKFTRNE